MRKIFALVLTALILLTVFASCGNNGANTDAPNGDNGGQPETQEENMSDSATEPEKLLPNLPESDFGGYEFRILVRGEEDGVWGSRDIIADEETGEPINDAVYRRNKYIEEKYNVKIVGIPSDVGKSKTAAIKKVISAGEDAYDVMIPQQNQIGGLITSGMFVNLKDIPYLDLSQPWWDQNVMRDLSVGNKVFTTAGDIHVTTNNAIRILLFNKQMITDYGLENPYELVKDNKWTLDKFYEMCRDVSLDVNGDGVFDEKDRYGYLVQTGITVNMFYACGENMTAKDENDIPYISLDSTRAISALQKINDILSSKNAVMFDSDYTHINSAHPEYVLQEVFEDKRGLFFAEVLQLAERMRATDTEFGILPMPKYDESQESYLHFADSHCMSLVTVPITNTELERTGILLEAMAAESKYTLTPAYYDKTLQGKYMRDNESSEMLDIIINTKIVSQDEMFGWGLQSVIQETLRKLNGDFASQIEKTIPKAQTKIEKTLASIEEE